ncbi:MAG: FtsQ-type POTRA domain-containing protein [Chloroflexi bacterium]|nr:FtsQ-type POTRA domain-containing protein [Chloroflexota bacterium]
MTATKKSQPVRFVSGRGARGARTRKRDMTIAQPLGHLHRAAPRITTLPRVQAPSWQALEPKFTAVVLIIAFALVLSKFLNDKRFLVYDFETTGLQRLTKGEMERAGGFVGYNVFFIDPSAIERRLAQMPEVKSAQVHTGLVNQLEIDVIEREPEMTWVVGNDSYWVDSSGIAFRARANLPDLPLVRDMDKYPVKPGGPVEPPAVAAVQALRTAWPSGPHVLEWSLARGLAWTDEHGWKIYLGNSHEMESKIVKLRLLVSQLSSQNAKVKFIDLSKGDPFYQ